jgi:predicted dehydrogenase
MVAGNEFQTTDTLLRYGMVGGGEGSFIGEVHRKAIGLDGKAILVSGCFSSDIDNTLRTGRALMLEEHRLYKNYDEMAITEGQKNDNKIDFVVIVTPNFTHYGVAKAFLENGINVVCDKPFTVTSDQAVELEQLAENNGLTICVTYTYTGYPIVKHVKAMIANRDIGDIRFVNAEYPQDWLSTLLEDTGQKQAEWRADPEKSGASNCVGDIGSHIENMVSYMTGLKIEQLSARLDTIVEGRRLDDNATIMVDYHGGSKGLYWCSQIAVGNDNGLRVRIFGSKGSIEWAQENPNYVTVASLEGPTQILSRGRDAIYPIAESFTRIPAGHPEGYFEAFANVYKAFIDFLVKTKKGEELLPEDSDFPGAAMGIDGVRFIEKCVESSAANAAWVVMK